MIYYISEKSELNGNGTREKPFKKITQAANIAVAGDTIVIGDGVYREWINPKNGGTSDNRITYINDENAKPVISGTEIIDGWKNRAIKFGARKSAMKFSAATTLIPISFSATGTIN